MNKLKIYFMRHGTTSFNEEGRFCGSTDALLSEKGWEECRQLKENYDYPAVERVYCSPSVRCRETASVFYPGMETIVKNDLREFDFGDGEKVSSRKYFGTDFYREWLKQNPVCNFGNGDFLLVVQFRMMAALTEIIGECMRDGISTIAIISHGISLGRLMDGCLVPEEHKDAFILCPNGMGLVGTVDPDTWFIRQELTFEALFPEGAPRLRLEDSPFFTTFEE